MLLNSTELKNVIKGWLRKPILDDLDGWAFLCAVEITNAERAKVAPHFDALPMMDSRELFMAGAEWGRRTAQEAVGEDSVIDQEVFATEFFAWAEANREALLKMTKTKAAAMAWMASSKPIMGEYTGDRRAELLELAGKLAVAGWGNAMAKQTVSVSSEATEEDIDKKVREAHDRRASACVSMAAAILEAVDKEVGKPEESRAPVRKMIKKWVTDGSVGAGFGSRVVEAVAATLGYDAASIVIQRSLMDPSGVVITIQGADK